MERFLEWELFKQIESKAKLRDKLAKTISTANDVLSYSKLISTWSFFALKASNANKQAVA
jgi:hypothetical protein